MPTMGRYGLRIAGPPIAGDPSNSAPSRVSGSAVLAAVERDRAQPSPEVGAVVEESPAPPGPPAAASSPGPAVTGQSILEMAQTRIGVLRMEIASLEGKKVELAMLEAMCKAVEK